MTLRVDVERLLRRSGQRREVTGRHTVRDLALTAGEVPDGAVDVDLELEAVGAEVVVTGTASATWLLECRRCLGPVPLPATVELREIFAREPVAGETYPLGDDDTVDLEPVVREALMLVPPAAPLCSDACAGPEPQRYPTGAQLDDDPADDQVDDADRPLDPRWAALDQLSFDQSTVE